MKAHSANVNLVSGFGGSWRYSEDGFIPHMPFLAESIRSAAAVLSLRRPPALRDPDDVGPPYPFRKSSLKHYLAGRFGSLAGQWDSSGDFCGFEKIFNFLVSCGDISHLGEGLYLPREARTQLLIPNFVRAAGCSPLQTLQLAESRKEQAKMTIGRVYPLLPKEISKTEPVEEIATSNGALRYFESVLNGIRSLIQTRGNLSFEGAEILAPSGRFEASEQLIEDGISLLRIRKEYFAVQGRGGATDSNTWKALDGDERRILGFSIRKSRHARCRASIREMNQNWEVTLPFSLPKSLEAVIISAASNFEFNDSNWIQTVVFPDASRPVVEEIFSALGISI